MYADIRSSKKNSLVLKLNVSFNSRHTVMGFVVKCSAVNKVFVP